MNNDLGRKIVISNGITSRVTCRLPWKEAARRKEKRTMNELDNATGQAVNVDQLVIFFRRYKRACCQHLGASWPADIVRQWEGDRLFLNEEYQKERNHTCFGSASDFAHERLCCGR